MISTIRYILFSFSLTFCFATFAQYKDYEPVKSKGNMPDDFTLHFSDKYKSQKSGIDKSEKRFDKKSKDEFYLKSNFSLHEMLYSGIVLYNDPISDYITKVAHEVLKDDPKLREQIRIYTLKSSSVNAFATDQGMLFFTMGLMAQIENEAQLAMIIAHELTHFTHKHSVNKYIEKKKIEESKRGYRNLSFDDKIKSLSSFSQENEVEADKEGFQLLKKTNYNYIDAIEVFNVLKYSYLPFQDIKFRNDFFNTKHYKLPERYFLKNVIEIGSLADNLKPDEYDTHPEIDKRIAYLRESITVSNDLRREKFIIGEDIFNNVQTIARHELNDIYINNLQYEKALYNAYLMLNIDSSDYHSKKTILKSLYGLSKYKNVGEFNYVHGDYKKREAEIQTIYFLFDTISAKELNILALNYGYRLDNYIQQSDKEVGLIVEDLFKELIKHHTQSISFFSKTPKERIVESNVKQDTVDYDNLTRTQKIMYKKGITQDNNDQISQYYQYAFVDLMDYRFEKLFDTVLKEYNDNKEQKLDYKVLRKQRAKIKRKGHSFGVDKLIIVDPLYVKLDKRKKDQLKYENSESSQIKLQEVIHENAKLLELEIEVLGNNSFTQTQTNKYNDFMVLNAWMSERAKHHKHVDLINLNKNSIIDVREAYKTPYVSWLAYVGTRYKKKGAGGYIALSLVYPIVLPFAIYYAATPHYDSKAFFVLFDLDNGNIMWVNTTDINIRDSKAVVKGKLYDTLYQVKKKK